MIEVVHPGWLSIVVDGGRHGYGDIGVPPSSALDDFAYNALNVLVGNEMGLPALEVIGSDFSLKIDVDVTCVITGAKVTAFIDNMPVKPWTSFRVHKGSTIKVKEILEGLRYYVGFSGAMGLERTIDSFSTNLECRFGGYDGRPLMKGDMIGFKEFKVVEERLIPEEHIPPMNPPHVLRVIEGAEIDYFTTESSEIFFGKGEKVWYTVSTRFNRTGIRLEGEPIEFKQDVDTSIISEGILPGTVQIPGNGLPIIMLYERTIGGYARCASVAKIDHYRLAHLKPKDKVMFEKIGIEEAEHLWMGKRAGMNFLLKQV